MNIFSTIKGWIKSLFSGRIKEEFNIEVVNSPEMSSFISECINIYRGCPNWINSDDGIKSVNFAKSVCSEVARLVTLDINVGIEGSVRGELLHKQIEAFYPEMRKWVEYAAAYGTIILKPNGEGVDAIAPNMFEVTSVEDGKIKGAVFYDVAHDPQSKKWYTRLEWHRFDGDIYRITNRCFISDTESGRGKPIDIKSTPWAVLTDDVAISNVDKMLFGVIRMPDANNIDPQSALGLPVFAGAINELADLDVAYSRNAEEIMDSARTVLLDSDRLFTSGQRVSSSMAAAAEKAGLPRFVKAVQGANNEDIYHEINPNLNTETRLTGINALLSQIGYKCGFSNGYFVFNESHGISTATQVEADQQRTVQLVKDIRDALKYGLDGLVYALDKFADLYTLAPAGLYEVNYNFGDITYSYEEDKAKWWGYVQAGKVPAWLYFVKFEGMTEEEAKEVTAEAQPKPLLFGGDDEFDTSLSGGADVQGKSLNGAQTQSLIAIMGQYSAEEITEGQAINLISTAIGISKTEAKKILNGEIE